MPDTITLPEVTLTKHRDRDRSFRFELGPDLDSDWATSGEPGVRFAELSATHMREHKCFYASLSLVVVMDRGNGMVGERRLLWDSLRVAVEPIGRFSAKRLDTFAAQALDRLSELLNEDTDAGAKARAYLEVEA